MIRLILPVFLTLLLPLITLQAQVRCYSDEYNHALEESHPGIKKAVLDLENTIRFRSGTMRIAGIAGQVLKIPVVVHVVHSDATNIPGGAGNTNISDEQIFSQITVLNEDFRRLPGTRGYNTDPIGADMEIEFCLASIDPQGNSTSGILRVYNSKSSWGQSEDVLLKSLSYWPSDQYLNIWVANLSNDVLGYAQFPHGSEIQDLDENTGSAETDGVVLDYKAFGATGTAASPYHLGRTATHEIGHWLGLRHMWDLAVSGNNCGDDGVTDTPLDDKPNNDSDCLDSSLCQSVWIRDMPNNYMDYSTDACFNLFTQGQKERVWAVLNSAPRRQALFNSPGCQTPLSILAELESGIHLLPNPALNEVRVYSRVAFSGSCEILSSTGAVVKTIDLAANHPLSLTDIPPGIYLFRIRLKEGVITRKLLKM